MIFHKNHICNIYELSKCDSCGKSFTETGSLKKHIKTIHKGKKVFKCDTCGKSFNTASYLNKHINNVH